MASEPSAIELRDALASGGLSARSLIDTCLKRVEAQEDTIEAWAWLDHEYARAAADRLDKLRAHGRGIGPLHGLPIGIKDIVDVRGMPCENGTVLDAGRRPHADAALVAALKAAGALIAGKTVTTELAYFSPGKTRNPHDPTRTPGGSSSGSAAAVAAGMVPAAIGSQTNGSVIRPASYCGVVGFKPTRGLISTKGTLCQAPNLDTLGTFARSVEDVALITDVIAQGDPEQVRPPAGLLDTCLSEPPLEPKLAFVKTPVWEQAAPDTQAGFFELIEALGERAETVELPQAFAQGHAAHRQINMVELSKNFAHYARRGRERLSEKMQAAIDEGLAINAPAYLNALDWIEVLNAGLEAVFENFDAIVTPAAPGEAPQDLTQTGNPTFCTLWTLCGTPAITLPLLTGSNGMPIGVQLVARRGDDARLLRTARWLSQYVANGDGT